MFFLLWITEKRITGRARISRPNFPTILFCLSVFFSQVNTFKSSNHEIKLEIKQVWLFCSFIVIYKFYFFLKNFISDLKRLFIIFFADFFQILFEFALIKFYFSAPQLFRFIKKTLFLLPNLLKNKLHQEIYRP